MTYDRRTAPAALDLSPQPPNQHMILNMCDETHSIKISATDISTYTLTKVNIMKKAEIRCIIDAWRCLSPNAGLDNTDTDKQVWWLIGGTALKVKERHCLKHSTPYQDVYSVAIRQQKRMNPVISWSWQWWGSPSCCYGWSGWCRWRRIIIGQRWQRPPS